MKFKNKALRIACDGGAASGKSLAAKLVGQKYGLYVLNSGIFYRYASFLIIKHKPKKITSFLKKKFKNINSKNIFKLDLHAQEISEHVVNLAKQKKVRNIIRTFQKKLIKKYPRIVVEGRDTASSIMHKNPRYTVAF